MNFYLALWYLSSSGFNPELKSMMSLLLSFVNQYFLLFFFMTSYLLLESGFVMLDIEIQDAILRYEVD